MFECKGFKSEYESSLRCFLDRSIPLHRASVIESLRLDLAYSGCKAEDIKLWMLYASKSLVTLKLSGNIRLDVPRMVGLPPLKTLQLRHLKLLDGQSFRKLLSICPVLENLSVMLYGGYVNMGKITVIIPSLLSLSLEIPSTGLQYGLVDGLVIDTPSLKYLKLEDYDNNNHSCLIEDMPQVEEAYLDVKCPDIERLIGSITSVKRLTLIFGGRLYINGRFVFDQLEHLELCVSTDCASSLLVRFTRRFLTYES
ncbi:RNI-like superfamily protein [Raphanus sativus]|nr:RNI-like superfamily protein [Raphanus sativus]